MERRQRKQDKKGKEVKSKEKVKERIWATGIFKLCQKLKDVLFQQQRYIATIMVIMPRLIRTPTETVIGQDFYSSQ